MICGFLLVSLLDRPHDALEEINEFGYCGCRQYEAMGDGPYLLFLFTVESDYPIKVQLKHVASQNDSVRPVGKSVIGGSG